MFTKTSRDQQAGPAGCGKCTKCCCFDFSCLLTSRCGMSAVRSLCCRGNRGSLLVYSTLCSQQEESSFKQHSPLTDEQVCRLVCHHALPVVWEHLAELVNEHLRGATAAGRVLRCSLTQTKDAFESCAADKEERSTVQARSAAIATAHHPRAADTPAPAATLACLCPHQLCLPCQLPLLAL